MPNTQYLEDTGVEVLGVRLWGSPWQPEFGNWAFNIKRGECHKKWSLIPENTDILLTHGPPLGHGDWLKSGNGARSGCVELLNDVQSRVKPAAHVFGHIHEAAGVTTDGQTLYVNASTCTAKYEPTNPPVVLDILPADEAAGRLRAEVIRQQDVVDAVDAVPAKLKEYFEKSTEVGAAMSEVPPKVEKH